MQPLSMSTATTLLNNASNHVFQLLKKATKTKQIETDMSKTAGIDFMIELKTPMSSIGGKHVVVNAQLLP
jgi:hypothetical protein